MATTAGGKPATKSKSAEQARRAAIFLKHVSNATRVQILLLLTDGERPAGALSDSLGKNQPAVTHHLIMMRHAGVLTPRRQGKNVFYSLSEKGVELAKVVKTLMG